MLKNIYLSSDSYIIMKRYVLKMTMMLERFSFNWSDIILRAHQWLGRKDSYSHDHFLLLCLFIARLREKTRPPYPCGPEPGKGL